MVKAALVGIDLEKGAEVLRILDHAGVKVSVAFWAYLPEYEDWRLVLASRQFDMLGLMQAYGLLNKTLDAAGMDAYKVPTISILRMDDKSIRDLRRKFSKSKRIEGLQLGGLLVGDRFIEDGYAYRIS